MKTQPSLFLLAASALLLTGCSKLKNFTEKNFNVTPTPLEYVAGEVPATISTNIPAKFMHKKAVITMTPVLRYNGIETAGTSATIQGENVEANHQIISRKNGAHTTLRTAFPYQNGMESAELYMTFDARKGNKAVSLPDVKIGYGTVATAALVADAARTAAPAISPDNFQRSIQQKQAATIKFLINQANLRGSELNSQTIRDFITTLRNIKSNEQSLVLNNIDVQAYASPDGAFNFNDKLAAERGSTAENYARQQLRQQKLDTNVDMKYTAEDWEGFQELVSQSSLQDKELILRVLSMYTDPEQREREIHNVATVYSELADAVLPELRRARMTINYEVIGRSDAQILEQLKQDPKQLSAEELLYAANILSDNDDSRQAVTTTGASIYPNDFRFKNNLAALALKSGRNTESVQATLRQLLASNPNAPELNANMGLLALRDGNVKDAELYLAKASGASNFDETLGLLAIAQGKYSNAVTKLSKTSGNGAILAGILAQDYASARLALENNKTPDTLTSYLKAVLGARMQNADYIRDGLRAVSTDATLTQRAKNDLEFANYQDLVKSILK
jgi:PBP1b-binding outer membrane lipoprotein LpoB